ncbi:hypothetical protein [Stenotrophomonas maltophilia]|uniref:hypothetical protein n=1 Tax=Stenotrophomonas maltophilia TaxID=40324 RepID=UPI001655D6C0|nr:hypothetical protein [Stenotrophomonas maltophilia]MBC8772330.1 hypothetical protein [Stenotrophomonas maltophilia]
MTTDNKTLADVQPGGRVRLGDQARVTISDDLLSSMAYAIPGAVETTDKAKAVAARVVEIYLSAQPSPGGQGNAVVTDAMVEAAHAAYWAHPDDSGEDRPCVRAALEAALATRQPVGEFRVVAYQQITPNADDPEVFDAKLWALPSGHPVPEGCTPLYWWIGKDAPPAQAVDLERFRGTVKSQYSMTEWMHRCGFVSAKKLEESKKNHDHLMALIDSQGAR